MTNRGIDIKDDKQRGEWAEMCFMQRAAEQGLRVTKPYGDSAHYDFAVEHNGRFLRVQVKSTKFKRRGSYVCTVLAAHKPYKASQIDFVAAYVIPADAWYIIPAHACCARHSIHLTPYLKTSRYGRYREAWHLLRSKPAKSRTATAGR